MTTQTAVTANVHARGSVYRRLLVSIALVLTFLSSAHSADTTWIEGTIRSVTKRPILIGHAMLVEPAVNLPLNEPRAEDRRKPFAITSVSADGRFRIATTEKGHHVLRITAPYHKPIERSVLCSGGHTILVDAIATTQFMPTNILTPGPVRRTDGWRLTEKRMDTIYSLKSVGKGLYAVNIPTTDSIIHYDFATSIRGVHHSEMAAGSQGVDGTRDSNGIYLSSVRSTNGIARVIVNTNVWLRSNAPSKLTFLSTDDATLDTLIMHIEQRNQVRPAGNPNAMRGVQRPAPSPLAAMPGSYSNYALRSNRVREVAALAYGVQWDSLKSIVPPTSMAWTIGQHAFFNVVLQAGGQQDVLDYTDTLFATHQVRRIIPPMQAAAAAYAFRFGMPERSQRLLADLQREFPNHERTSERRRLADRNRPIQVGKPMPEFEWMSASTPPQRISSSSQAGNLTLYFLWGAREQNTTLLADLQRLQAKYAAAGLHVVGIFAGSSSTQPEWLASNMQQYAWPTVYSDGSQQSPAVLLDNAAPFTLLVGPDNRIVMVSGGLNIVELDEQLAKHLRK